MNMLTELNLLSDSDMAGLREGDLVGFYSLQQPPSKVEMITAL